MMADMGSVEGSTMKVGLCTYDHVVIPAMDTLDSNTVALLKEYMANGGKVYLFGKVPTRVDGRKADLSWLQSTCGFEDLQATADLVIAKNGVNVPQLRQMVRKTENGRLFFITNLTGECLENVEITLRGGKGLYALDMNTLDYTLLPAVVNENSCTVTLTFEDSEACVLVEAPESAAPAEARPVPAAIPLNGGFELTAPVENMMTLDYAEISYDGEHFEKPRPIILIKDMLLQNRYKGKLWLKYSFNVEEKPASLHVAAEPMAYCSVAVNGKPVALDGDWWFDRSFLTVDVAPYVHTGRNEVVMELDYFQRDYVYYVLYGGVSESLRNCLSFDMEIESIYLYGEFGVKTDNTKMTTEGVACYYTGEFAIVPQKKSIDLTNVVTDGFPFFGGAIEAKTVYNYTPGAPTELVITGRCSVCDVTVNGTFAGRLLFKQHMDLSAYLQEGENTIALKLYNANRNLLGPHHYIQAEPLSVGPTTFSLESQWKDEQCPNYADRYAFVRFGIDCE